MKEVKRLFAVFLLYFPVAGQSDWRLLQKSGGNVEKQSGAKSFYLRSRNRRAIVEKQP